MAKETVKLNPGESVDLAFGQWVSVEGNWHVQIDGLEQSFQVTMPPKEHAELKGKVIWADAGWNLNNVHITLIELGLTTSTNLVGDWHIGNIPYEPDGSTYTLRFERGSNYYPKEISVNVNADVVDVGVVELQGLAHIATVTTQAVAYMEPIPGALLRWQNDYTSEIFEFVTDGNAVAICEIPPGQYTLAVSAEGYITLTASHYLEPNKASNITRKLQRDFWNGDIMGYVFDAETGGGLGDNLGKVTVLETGDTSIIESSGDSSYYWLRDILCSGTEACCDFTLRFEHKRYYTKDVSARLCRYALSKDVTLDPLPEPPPPGYGVLEGYVGASDPITRTHVTDCSVIDIRFRRGAGYSSISKGQETYIINPDHSGFFSIELPEGIWAVDSIIWDENEEAAYYGLGSYNREIVEGETYYCTKRRVEGKICDFRLWIWSREHMESLGWYWPVYR